MGQDLPPEGVGKPSEQKPDQRVESCQTRRSVHGNQLWHGRRALGIVCVVEATNSQEQLPERTAEEIERLCAESGDLVERVMSHLKQAGIHADWEELRAFGRQGLVEAAVRFDPEQGDDFRRYAYFRVKGAMLDGMRKMSTWSRRGYERIVLLRASNSTTQGLSAEQLGEPPDAQQAAGRLQKHMAAVVTGSPGRIPSPSPRICSHWLLAICV